MRYHTAMSDYRCLERDLFYLDTVNYGFPNFPSIVTFAGERTIQNDFRL